MADFITPARNQRILGNIAAAVQFRDSTAGPRAHQGMAPIGIKVCLGLGRCLLAQADADAFVCPFCAEYPSNGTDEAHQKAFAHQISTGN